MTISRRIKAIAMFPALGLLAAAPVFADGSIKPCKTTSPVSAVAAAPTKDIIDTAIGAGSFKTLAAALKAAGLIDALKGDGPFTVFAPTDDAFAALPAGTVEMLLKPENKGLLTAILTYHVVPGNLKAADVVKADKLVTLNGQKLNLTTQGGVMIADAKVVRTDIATSNGTIHVIDKVLMPNTKDVIDALASITGAAAKAESVRPNPPEDKAPKPSDFVVQPVGVRYVQGDRVLADSEVEGESFDFKVGRRFWEAPKGTDILLFLDPKDDKTFVTDSGNGGQLISLVDSTGKNLLEFPGEPAIVPFEKGGWQAYFREGLEGGSGFGVIQAYMIRANYAPSKDAEFVIAKGYVDARVSTTKRTEKTAFGKIEKGAELKSENLMLKIMSAKIQPDQKPAMQMKIDNYKAPGSAVALICPLTRHAYESWRLVDGNGQAHQLSHRGIGSAGIRGKELRLGETLVMSDKVLTEGSLEVVYWSDLQKVRVPFEVKVYLKKQSDEMKQYNKKVREEHPKFYKL